MSNWILTLFINTGLWTGISHEDFELDSIAHLSLTEAAGLTHPTLPELQTLKLESSRGPGWIAHYFYIFGICILTLFLLGAMWYGPYIYNFLYHRINSSTEVFPLEN